MTEPSTSAGATVNLGPLLAWIRRRLTSHAPAVTFAAERRAITLQQRHVSWLAMAAAVIALVLIVRPFGSAGPADQVVGFLRAIEQGDTTAAAKFVTPSDSTSQRIYNLAGLDSPGTATDFEPWNVHMVFDRLVVQQTEISPTQAAVTAAATLTASYRGLAWGTKSFVPEFQLSLVNGNWLIVGSYWPAA